MARDLTLKATLRPPNAPIYTSIGGVEYVWIDVTEDQGLDISGLTWEIAVGSTKKPGTWSAPDSKTEVSTGKVSLGFLVGGTHLTPAAGSYVAWVRLTDDPETIVRQTSGGVFTVDGPPLVVSTFTVTDNLDGTLTLAGSAVTDNLDGTLGLLDSGVTDNLDGTLALIGG